VPTLPTKDQIKHPKFPKKTAPLKINENTLLERLTHNRLSAILSPMSKHTYNNGDQNMKSINKSNVLRNLLGKEALAASKEALAAIEELKQAGYYDEPGYQRRINEMRIRAEGRPNCR